RPREPCRRVPRARGHSPRAAAVAEGPRRAQSRRTNFERRKPPLARERAPTPDEARHSTQRPQTHDRERIAGRNRITRRSRARITTQKRRDPQPESEPKARPSGRRWLPQPPSTNLSAGNRNVGQPKRIEKG